MAGSLKQAGDFAGVTGILKYAISLANHNFIQSKALDFCLLNTIEIATHAACWAISH